MTARKPDTFFFALTIKDTYKSDTTNFQVHTAAQCFQKHNARMFLQNKGAHNIGTMYGQQNLMK